jgi:hypothetical protein
MPHGSLILAGSFVSHGTLLILDSLLRIGTLNSYDSIIPYGSLCQFVSLSTAMVLSCAMDHFSPMALFGRVVQSSEMVLSQLMFRSYLLVLSRY